MRTETTIKAMNSIAKVSMSGRRVNGLFRLATNPEVLWKQAYANIYSNKGAITKGVDRNTLDGFSEERVNHLIGLLERREYCPKPLRRRYFPKRMESCVLSVFQPETTNWCKKWSESFLSKSMSLFSLKILMDSDRENPVILLCDR